LYYNGNTIPNNVLNFSDLINADEIIIISHPSAEVAILEHADITYGGLLFNGDDAVALFRDDVLIDIVGEIGYDPGSGWAISGIDVASQNKTIIRKASIGSGNLNWSVSAGTDPEDSEWIVYDLDNFDFIGWHNMDIQLETPRNITLILDGNSITLNWDPVPRASEYIVYSSINPISDFDIDNSGIFSGSSWIGPVTNERKFFRITAE